jgi:hypothetical protein
MDEFEREVAALAWMGGLDPITDLVGDLARRVDLTRPIVVEHSIFAESEAAADSVRDLAEGHGFTTTIERLKQRGRPDIWMISAFHSIVVSVASLKQHEADWKHALAGIPGARYSGPGIEIELDSP